MAQTLTKRGAKPAAKRPKKDGTSSGKSNHRERPVVIREAIRKLQDLQKRSDQIAAEKKEVNNILIRGELAMTVKDFHRAWGDALLEPEERSQLFATTREIFAAMKAGEKGQIDFLSAMEEADRAVIESRPKPTAPADPVHAYNDGYAKGEEVGNSMSDNPYTKKDSPKLFESWDNGFKDGQIARYERSQAAIKKAVETGNLGDVAAAVEAQSKPAGKASASKLN